MLYPASLKLMGVWPLISVGAGSGLQAQTVPLLLTLSSALRHEVSLISIGLYMAYGANHCEQAWHRLAHCFFRSSLNSIFSFFLNYQRHGIFKSAQSWFNSSNGSRVQPVLALLQIPSKGVVRKWPLLFIPVEASVRVWLALLLLMYSHSQQVIRLHSLAPPLIYMEDLVRMNKWLLQTQLIFPEWIHCLAYVPLCSAWCSGRPQGEVS